MKLKCINYLSIQIGMNSCIVLFDIDRTLTVPRGVVSAEMIALLTKLRSIVTIALVGGSDRGKMLEQMTPEFVDSLEYAFSENGTVFHSYGRERAAVSMREHLGNSAMQHIVNYAMKYMSDVFLPVKRGCFIEDRRGLINIALPGRTCTQQEREDFVEYDSKHHVRKYFVDALRTGLSGLNLQFSVGGQISVDVMPQGWDKTFSLRYLDNFQKIIFFGDQTEIGGNDYEIFSHPRVEGHKVTCPEDTMKQVREMFGI